jgi:hypothetical protein
MKFNVFLKLKLACKLNSVTDILFIHIHILQGVDPILLARDKAIG